MCCSWMVDMLAGEGRVLPFGSFDGGLDRFVGDLESNLGGMFVSGFEVEALGGDV
jgi:hypothetical protein